MSISSSARIVETGSTLQQTIDDMADLNDRGFNVSSRIGDTGEIKYEKTLEWAKNNGKIVSYIDLTKNEQARHDDCDFVVFTGFRKDGKEYTEENAEWILKNTRTHPKQCKFIEVKTDTLILETGNVYLEWIAHDVPGCFAITKADKWIYYGVNADGKIVKGWSLDIPKIRSLFAAALITPKNGSVNVYPDVKTGNYGYRVKIDTLIHLGAAKEMKV